MEVHVFSPDQSEYWGKGIIEEIGVFNIRDNNGNILHETESYPSVIKLSDGEKVEGMNCWWHPIENFQKILEDN